MKFLSNKEMIKIAKSTLALVIAGGFTFSTTIASAEENNQEKYESVDLQKLTPPSASTDVSAKVDSSNVKESLIQQEESDKETPSLVPGNFLYFAKITLEKIQLALTFDQEKEAELLAKFASERLAEADALFAKGKEDEAIKVIEKALENIENADNIADENKNPKQENEDGKTEGASSKDQNIANNDQSIDEVTVEDKGTEEDAIDEINELISQNIIALKAAMEKVKNPVAKAALQKNIDKSYAKLAKKIEKLDKKYGSNQEPEKNEDKEDIPSLENENLDSTSTDMVVVNKEKKETKSEVKEENKEKAAQVREENKKAKEAVKEEAKQAKELEKIETKQAKEAAKLQEKQERIVEKNKEKQVREEAKSEWKESKNTVKQQKEIQKEKKASIQDEQQENHQENHDEKGNKGNK
ncbi:hypothetical protein KHA94_01935 [Bacillus sp. FJAT-49705]|uniref:DUF5667 domain-containing protein n=1 Tax=Cytobacillus citreus TaxID=2833586 RepID=A0ABS5NN32_9BACI|nr:DUF5667 domain-containing protein [Cytobacillus citreus]MBS4188976.1 hypothetical protein [Cytobacillus citreus]